VKNRKKDIKLDGGKRRMDGPKARKKDGKK
jgi:hypothetical protein